jgi:hypothetical protein
MDHRMIADTLMMVVSTIEICRCLAVCNKTHYTEVHRGFLYITWSRAFTELNVYEYIVEKYSVVGCCADSVLHYINKTVHLCNC